MSNCSFVDWLPCPVCHVETRHYTKDAYNYAKMRRVWCEKCRVVRVQLKNSNDKWE